MPIARPEVVLVLPSFASGGAERVSLSLIAGLAPEAGTVVVFNRQGPLRSLLPTGMHVHDIDRPRLRRAWPVLLRWLREYRPGVVFSTFGHVNLALLAMRPLLPSRHAACHPRVQHAVARLAARASACARADAARLSAAVPDRRPGAVPAQGRWPRR